MDYPNQNGVYTTLILTNANGQELLWRSKFYGFKMDQEAGNFGEPGTFANNTGLLLIIII